MHVYSTPNTTSWVIPTPDGHFGSEWSGTGDFIKIRDQLYFARWQEEACNGTLGTIFINMRTMHDAGIGYHCGEEGLSPERGRRARPPCRQDRPRQILPARLRKQHMDTTPAPRRHRPALLPQDRRAGGDPGRRARRSGLRARGDDSRSKLARLEDERAIERLQRAFLRHFNGAPGADCSAFVAPEDAVSLDPGVCAIAADPGVEGSVAFAPDGKSASYTHPCQVEIEQQFDGTTTLERMARFQGHGSHRRSEPRVLTSEVARTSDGWVITRLALA